MKDLTPEQLQQWRQTLKRILKVKYKRKFCEHLDNNPEYLKLLRQRLTEKHGNLIDVSSFLEARKGFRATYQTGQK